MIISQKYRITWLGIPMVIRSFLLKGLLLLIIWKFIYLLFLLPDRVLDDPLTRFIGLESVNAINLFSTNHKFYSQNGFADNDLNGINKNRVIDVMYDNKKVLEIADPCNGLELMVLYVGFIICLPSYKVRKLLFILGGLISICFLNIVRCALLTDIAVNKPQYLNFSHHYVFNFIVYACIFILWLRYSRKIYIHSNEKA